VQFPLQQFLKRETPFYHYDMDLLSQTLDSLNQANSYGFKVHYALKANVNPEILKLIRHKGLGIDCVSGNEVKLALENGFEPNQIVLAGVGKTDKEIAYAIDHDIFSFNVESIQELQVIDEIAAHKGKRPNVSIRVNPEVEAGTHHYITTGSKHNKFGITRTELFQNLKLIQALNNIAFIGVHYHIGSQIVDLERFKNLCSRVNDVQRQLIAHNIPLPHINVGGGLGIDYENPDANGIPDFTNYFKLFKDNLEVLEGQEVHFELGRAIVGQCGTLVTKVLYNKSSGDVDFLIVDAGMTELMRPALYQAQHLLENISNPNGNLVKYDVAGPICESSDFFGKDLELTESKRSDLIAIRSTGAYGETMRNHYNARDYALAYFYSHSEAND
jgi:diaminopimelate decarboxylase